MKCLICGKLLPPRNKKYCSRQCKFQGQKGKHLSEKTKKKLRETHLGKTRPAKKEIEVNGILYKAYQFRRKSNLTKTYYKVRVICPTCRKSRLVWACSLRKYGVTECFTCSQKNPNTFRGFIWLGKRRFKKKCLTCGKTFMVIKSQLTKRKYCSWECQPKYKGEFHYNWQGGKSFEPYGLEFNNQLKEQIRERDNYSCQECYQTEKKLGYRLTCHHIDYNKKNNNPDNLICLCKSCHSQTNFGREDWTNYFNNKL